MSDQAFVKAFSRRRPANDQSKQAGGVDLGSAARTDQQPCASQTTSDTEMRQAIRQRISASESGMSGELQLDQSVASTARVWVDHHADRVSRADYAEDGIPRPHLEAVTGDRNPLSEPQDDQVERSGVSPGIGSTDQSMHQRNACAVEEQADFAQPAQDTDASTFNGAASFVNDEWGRIGPAEVLRAMREAGADSLASNTMFDNDLAKRQSQPSSESVAHTKPFQPTADTPELFIENPFANAAKEESGPESASPQVAHFQDSIPDASQPATDQPLGLNDSFSTSGSNDWGQEVSERGLKPFQAVWEVDVLDVPTTVADLFFEGRLFQQIAERMSDAIESGLNSVIVTSTQAGEGRSSVAIGLAMAAAAAGKRVALVDANLEHPKLADELRLDLQYGWVDTIRAGLPIKEVAVHAVEDGVTLIPLMPPKGKNAATGYEVVQLVSVLKDKFELIIVDGPTSQSGQIHQCASAVDSAIIVRDMKRTDTLAINEFSYRLRESGLQGVGVVENFI